MFVVRSIIVRKWEERMKRSGLVGLVIAAGLTSGFGVCSAADKAIDIGKREYQENCVACHGSAGKGDGSYMAVLNASPSDLTVLAKKNGGVFPVNRVYEVIDGRQQVKSHGPREMPIWGNDYNTKAVTVYDDFPFASEAYTRGRILALIDYLYRLQVK